MFLLLWIGKMKSIYKPNEKRQQSSRLISYYYFTEATD